MGCALLSQDLTLDCRDSLGGIVEIYITNKDNVTSKTMTAGVITAINKTASTKYYKWKLPKNTGELKEDTKISEENGTQYEEQLVDLVFNKLSTNTRNEILLASRDVTDVIVKDVNGKYWNPGFEGGMICTAKTAGTGKAKADRSGYTIQFKGEEKDSFVEVSASVIASITVANP